METRQDNSQNLKQLLKLFDTSKIVSNSDIEAVLAALVKLLANFKQSTEALNAETKQQVNDLFEKIAEQQYRLQQQVDETMGMSKAEMDGKMEKMISDCKTLMEECKMLMPQNGVDGKDADEEKIVEEVLAKIKLPEYKEVVLDGGKEIVDKINELPTDNDDDKIDVSHIKGLKKFVKENQTQMIGGGITGRDLFKDIDLSDSLDGVTATFNIQAVWNIINVSLSSYPYGALRKGVDYTWTPTSITFTSEIDPATQLSAGQKCILTVVLA